MQYEEHIRSDDQLRIVLADDQEAIAALDPSEPILLSRAALKRLGEVKMKLLIPHSPTLSPTSAREIISLLIRANSR